MKARGQTLLLSLSVIFLSITLPLKVEAGCDSQEAPAYSVSLSTQSRPQVDYGEVAGCQSLKGSFQSSKGETLDFEWANCVASCEKEFKPAEIYVRVGNTFKPGSHKRDGWDKTCMRQFGSATMHCLETL